MDILSMVDLTSISAILAAIGVIVGVVFAILELRNLVKQRQTDLVMRLYTTFGGKEFQEAWLRLKDMEFKDYNDFVEKYGWSEYNQIAWPYEGLGVLLHRKLIDISLVDNLLKGPIKRTWEKMKPIVEGYRNQFNDPSELEWFEHLYNEMQKREQQLAQT